MIVSVTGTSSFFLLLFAFAVECIVVFVRVLLSLWRQRSYDDKYQEKHRSECSGGYYCREDTVIVQEKLQRIPQCGTESIYRISVAREPKR